jgi:hypothetical protein
MKKWTFLICIECFNCSDLARLRISSSSLRNNPIIQADPGFSIRAYPRGKPYTPLLFYQLPKPLTTPKAIKGGVSAGLFAIIRVEAHSLLQRLKGDIGLTL